MNNTLINIIMIIIAIILFILAFIIGIKEKLSWIIKNKDILEKMNTQDKREASKNIASPLWLMGILFIAFTMSNGKWGTSAYIFLLVSIVLFIYVEVKTIKNVILKISSKKSKNKNNINGIRNNNRKNKKIK